MSQFAFLQREWSAVFEAAERAEAPVHADPRTPKDEVDRNTYGLFDLEDGVPTDACSLEEAVRDGFLVPPQAVSVPLKFQREGITEVAATYGDPGTDGEVRSSLADVLQREPGFARLRDRVAQIGGLLEEKAAIPMVHEQMAPIQDVQTDEWWQDVTVPMLEVMRRAPIRSWTT